MRVFTKNGRSPCATVGDTTKLQGPYLCRTVDPAARGATVLLGERLDAPTLVALAAGPGCKTDRIFNFTIHIHTYR